MIDKLIPHDKVKELFILAILLAAAIRLYLFWQYYCISSDGLHYIDAAKEFWAGKLGAGLSSVYPPGYPFIITCFYALIGDWELAGQVPSIIAGILLVWPLFLLYRDAFGEANALVACFLLAISPFLARYSAHVRSESVYFFLSSIALLLFFRGIERNNLRQFLYGGLIAGFAYLVRPEAIGFLLIIPSYWVVRWFYQRRPNFIWIAKSCALMGIGFFLFALPYIVYLSIDTGRWGALSRKAGVTLAVSIKESGLIAANDSVDGGDTDSMDVDEFVRKHPGIYLKKVALDILPATAVFFEALHYSYVPFLLLGMTIIFQRRFWERKDFLLLIFVLFYVFGFTLIYVKRRYSLQAVPFALGWVALGFGILWTYAAQKISAKRGKFILFSILALFLASTLPKTLTPISREKGYVRETGWYLRKHYPADRLRVAVFDDRVTFYSGSTPLLLTDVTEIDLARFLRKEKANYLASDSKFIQRFYPGVAQNPRDYGLVMEHEFVGTRKDRMLLFKVM